MSKHFAPCGFYNKETGEIKIALFNSDCHDENWVDAYFLCDCKNFQEGCIAIPDPMKPMTDGEITRDYTKVTAQTFYGIFKEGVRFAEKHHGISGENQ